MNNHPAFRPARLAAAAILLVLAVIPAASAHTMSVTLPIGHAIDDWHGPTGTQVTTTTHFGHVVASVSGPEGLVVIRSKGTDNTTAVQSLDLPADAPDNAEDIAALQATVQELEGTVANLTSTIVSAKESIVAARAEVAALGAKVQAATSAGEAAKRAAEDVPRHNMTHLQASVDEAGVTAEKARGVGFVAALAAMLACILGAASLVVALRRPTAGVQDDGGPLAPTPAPKLATEPIPVAWPGDPKPVEPPARVPTEPEIEAWLAKQLDNNPTLAAKLATLAQPAQPAAPA